MIPITDVLCCIYLFLGYISLSIVYGQYRDHREPVTIPLGFTVLVVYIFLSPIGLILSLGYVIIIKLAPKSSIDIKPTI
jgi:hypothetical protein